MALSAIEAERLGAGERNSGHMLLALLRATPSIAMTVLLDRFDISRDAIEQDVLIALSVTGATRERYTRERQAYIAASPNRYWSLYS